MCIIICTIVIFRSKINKMKDKSAQSRDRMLALYDAAPYPEVLQSSLPQTTALLSHWINAVSAYGTPALSNSSKILVAGCGSGAEVFMLANLFPEAKVVGIDFSERSIAKAKELALTSTLSNISFEVADLMSADCKSYDSMDFILCHGVADYVSDPGILMQTLAGCLSEEGVIYMTANSPYHPAGRIRDAFSALGIPPEAFTDSPDQRLLLQLITQLMGTDAKLLGLGTAPKAYLDVDIFPPIAHHDSMETWCRHAEEAGLYFSGSMDAPIGLLQLSDEQLPMLYKLGKAELSQWLANIYQRPGMQLLFSRKNLNEPNFELPALWDWHPRLDACLGLLPELDEDPNQLRSLTLRFQGLPDFVINSTAYDLEILRRCEGKLSLGQIRKSLAVDGNTDSLVACLYRAYHYGLLSD